MGKTFKFEGRYITIEATAYQNNNTLAILAYYDDDPDDEDVLTVNLNHPMLQSKETAFVDTNNISWAERFIEETGIGEYLNISQPSGFWTYPLYKFDLSKIQ